MFALWHFTSVELHKHHERTIKVSHMTFALHFFYIPVGILCLFRSIYTTLGLCVRHWSKKGCVYYESPMGYHQNTHSLLTGTPPIHKERDGHFWLPFRVEHCFYMACFIKRSYLSRYWDSLSARHSNTAILYLKGFCLSFIKALALKGYKHAVPLHHVYRYIHLELYTKLSIKHLMDCILK